MVIILRDGTEHFLDDLRSKVIRTTIAKGAKMIDLYGDERAVVSVSSIAQILTDEQFEVAYSRKPKGAPIEEQPLDLDWLKAGREKSPLSAKGKDWLRLLGLNNQQLRETGKYGSLRTLEELYQFEVDGIWPPEVPRKPKVQWISQVQPDNSPFPNPDRKLKRRAIAVPLDEPLDESVMLDS